MNSNNRQFNLSRRNSLKFVAGAIGTGILAARAGAELAAPEPVIAENPLNPDRALQLLIEGNERFVENKRKIPTKTGRASPKLPHLKHPLLLFSAVQIPAFLRKLSSIEDLEIYLSVAWPEMWLPQKKLAAWNLARWYWEQK
jgi:hypothetical protein